MITRAIRECLPWVLVSFVYGCGTVPEGKLGPPLQAAWYFQPERDGRPVAEPVSRIEAGQAGSSAVQVGVTAAGAATAGIEVRAKGTSDAELELRRSGATFAQIEVKTAGSTAALIEVRAVRAVEIEIVLMNRSSRNTRVEKVFLNDNDLDEQSAWLFDSPFDLEPGGMHVLPTSKFRRVGSDTAGKNDGIAGKTTHVKGFHESCLLPVSMFVLLDKETRPWFQRVYGWMIWDKKERIYIDFIGRMPSSLPQEWRGC